MSILKKIKKIKVNEEEISKLIPSINESLAKFSKEDLIKRMIAIEFEQLLKYYENSRDISSEKEKEDLAFQMKINKDFLLT